MDKKKLKTDVIIPVYRPDRRLFTLLKRLSGQTLKINKVILINTEEKYFESLVYGTSFQKQYGKLVEVHHISRREFDHGGTRHLAVTKSDADIFVMMTQDALPANEKLLENLIKPLEAENTAVSYARQLPAPDCSVIEKYTRQFNYPDGSCLKTLADLERLGVKTYFCSNVCAAYKRSVYDRLNGFVRRTIFNEDMIFSANAIKNGYAVAYAADAQVIHSHNYTCLQQLQRNFDLGVSQADHPEIFKGLPSEKEGKRLVFKTISWLWKSRRGYLIPYFCIQCGYRYAGYFLGKHYFALPDFLIKSCTSNKPYWQKRP